MKSSDPLPADFDAGKRSRLEDKLFQTFRMILSLICLNCGTLKGEQPVLGKSLGKTWSVGHP